MDLGDAGEVCENAWECDSGACFYEDSVGYCTIECASSAACPTDWSCESRSGGMYCVQP